MWRRGALTVGVRGVVPKLGGIAGGLQNNVARHAVQSYLSTVVGERLFQISGLVNYVRI